MKPSRIITSPSSFVVEDYAPGLTVDFREPGATSDLERARRSIDTEPWRDLPLVEQLERADAACHELSVAERTGDFTESLMKFSGAEDPGAALRATGEALGVATDDTVDTITALLEATGLFERAPHYPVRLYCHDPKTATELESDATHFGFVLDASPDLTLELDDGRRYPLHTSTYFCSPQPARIVGAGRIEILSRFGVQGLLSLGGPVEPWGRLRYIDGCTDTMLVPPAKLGDPCFNALYFPAHTRQTQHTHPSLRAGIVLGGSGVCKTPSGDHELEPGRIFFLPPETWHSFHTGEGHRDGEERAALTVVAFHPDSDFGPTDDDHPMLNRTYFEFLHRLRSTLRTREAGG